MLLAYCLPSLLLPLALLLSPAPFPLPACTLLEHRSYYTVLLPLLGLLLLYPCSSAVRYLCICLLLLAGILMYVQTLQ
jgi:hypothetical protein